MDQSNTAEKDDSIPVSVDWLQDYPSDSPRFFHCVLGLKLCGSLQLPALTDALNALIRRHDAFSICVSTPDGENMTARISTPAWLQIEATDITHLNAKSRQSAMEQSATEFTNIPFDLGTPPWLRAQLYKTAPQEHILLLCFHHTIFDGWSGGIVVRELGEIYDARLEGRAPTLRPLPTTLRNYLIAREQAAKTDAFRKTIAFWENRFPSQPPPYWVPRDAATLQGEDSWTRMQRFSIPSATADEVQRLSRRERISPWMAALACFAAAYCWLSHQTEVFIYVVHPGRFKPAEADLIGLLADFWYLKVSVGELTTPADILRSVRASYLEALPHLTVPGKRAFAHLHQFPKPEHAIGIPYFNYIPNFCLDQTGKRGNTDGTRTHDPERSLTLSQCDPPLSLARVRTLKIASPNTLGVNLCELNGEISGNITCTHLVREATVDQLITRFQSLLQSLAAGSRTAVMSSDHAL